MHKRKRSNNGFIIALAWPETYCKQPGSWYDGFMKKLGISKNHYYKAGHAALILINSKYPKCHYFDFGRYHAPFQYGRVRCEETDHDLQIMTIPQISCDGLQIVNYQEILDELQSKHAFHGDGNLYSSYEKVNFDKAFAYAKNMQRKSPLPYGPFKYRGSNCSRFVNSVMLNGDLTFWQILKLKYMVPLTPTPMNNVNALTHKFVTAKKFANNVQLPKIVDKDILRSTLLPPEQPKHLPANAQWLSGEGAGSWFVYNHVQNKIKVSRYSPDGNLECVGYYKNHKDYSSYFKQYLPIDYPSNCKVVSLLIDNEKVLFERVE